MSDLAGLLAIWAFVQVLVAWCLNRWGKVQARQYEHYVISPERNETASCAGGRHLSGAGVRQAGPRTRRAKV